MWRLLRTSGYSYPRVTTIQIDIHRAGENPINMTHTLSTSVHIRPAYASYGQSPYVTTFHESSTDLFGSHCFREKDSRHNPRIHTQFLSQANQWSSKLKPSFCRWQATRFTGSISPAYDRYVQYFLRGPTHRSLTDTGGGYNLGGVGFSHTLPNLPNQLSPLFT
jgi:hypothetical protein